DSQILAFIHGGQTVIARTQGRWLGYTDLASGRRQVRELPAGEQAVRVASTDDGRLLAVQVSDHRVRIVDARGERARFLVLEEKGYINSLAVRSDGRLVCLGTTVPVRPEDGSRTPWQRPDPRAGSAVVWDVNEGKELDRLAVSSPSVPVARFFPD